VDQRNVDVIRAVFAAFSRGGEESLAALDYLDPEVAVNDHPGFPDAEWHHGREGAIRWARKIYEVAGQVTVEPFDFIEGPEGRIAFQFKMRAEGKRSGLSTPTTIGYGVFTIREGKVIRGEAFKTRAEALDAAGVRG
jgi:ketosteroid isomerase-like protein